MLKIDYRESDQRSVLTWSPDDESSDWLIVVQRLVRDNAVDATHEGAYRLSLPWWNFVALRTELGSIFQAHGVAQGIDLEVTAAAASLLRISKLVSEDYAASYAADPIEATDLESHLSNLGFLRELSPEQLRNVCKMAAFPAAATFSVPGAGKTTEALAFFHYKSTGGDRLLVVAPKNAFAAWDQEKAECTPTASEPFTRLRGGRDRIAELLDQDTPFMLITYQQLIIVADLIAAHCAQHRVFVFLDESHRIKGGSGVQTQAVLRLAHLPVGKLILSGTPMPQSIDDLVPQFRFLYPEVSPINRDMVDLFRPVFVRTNKKELGLPPLTLHVVPLPMAPLQSELYRLMKSEIARQAASALSIHSRQAFRSLGRSVARLLQFVSNPVLLSSEIGFAHPDLLAAVLSEGDGPKIHYVLGRARQLARDQKVLIWTSFVRNVEYLASRLSDLGAVYIHGGVDAGDEDDDGSREGKIKRFHNDPTIRIMVANPAAAGEGISLHKICHHALYLDRTFNAAHYMQSQDRIHRFGLNPDQKTTIEIVECTSSIDETVRMRLDFKIGQMAQALEDSSLQVDPIPLDPTDIEDLDEYTTGLAADDVLALLTDLTREGS